MQPNDLQSAFASAIWSRDIDLPGWVTPSGRFAIHRNNVFAGLLACLEARFPVSRRLLGSDSFRHGALSFIEAHPPQSPILMEYGARLPDFFAALDHPRPLACLPDIARLEWHQHVSLHGAEASPLDATTLGDVAPESMAALVFALHPTAHVLRSHFPILSIWRANALEGASINVAADAPGEDVLIVRPGSTVLLVPLAPGAAAFLHAVGRGASLADASAAATYADERFDLTPTLASLLRHKIFTGYSFAEDPEIQ
ncbi:putative DNA-binding domain-containing protein [Dongia sp.]|uniref:HvfC/BufC family peptide modification chaperone n=1 Tax=Dongia sp. TaxID=1977262 RepID=UPI0035AEDBE9